MAERRKDRKGRVLKEGESQRKDGSYDFRWRTSDGKRHSVYARTLEELREKEQAIQRDKSDGIRTDAKNVTLNDIYDMWIGLKKGLKDNTFQNYQYMYNQFVYPDFGQLKVAKMKRSDVRRFYNMLADERMLKISTIDNIHTVLHQVLDLAVEDEYLRSNPSDNALKELKQSHNFDVEKRRALTVQEQNAFTAFLANSRQYNHWNPIFTVMLGTGLRVGEVTGLRWEDLDFENRLININHSVTYYAREGSKTRKSEFAVSLPKTEAGIRTVPMMDAVYNAFKEEYEVQKENGFNSTVIDGMTGFIFCNRFGNIHNPQTVNRTIKRILENYNAEEVVNAKKERRQPVIIPHFSCHHLRHTFCTRFCEKETNIKVIQAVMGHANIETTMDIYAEVTDAKKKEAIENLSHNLDIF